MFSLIVEFLIDQDHVLAFEKHAVSQAKSSLEREEFCHAFEVCQDSEKPNRFLFYELYEDREAFEAHLTTFHYYDFDRTVAPWVTFKNIEFFLKIS